MLVQCKTILKKKERERGKKKQYKLNQSEFFNKGFTKRPAWTFYPRVTYKNINFPDESHGKGSTWKENVGIWMNTSKKSLINEKRHKSLLTLVQADEMKYRIKCKVENYIKLLFF